MELYDHSLKYKSLEDFTNGCKGSFSQFRAFGKIASAVKGNLSIYRVFNNAFTLMNFYKSPYKMQMNKVLCGPLKFTGP